MINSLCILFSLTMVIYVVIRAAMLDSKRPWFQKATPAEPLPDATPGPARPRIPARR